MGVRVHKPPRRAKIPEIEPLVFLAGPIQGAPDWQKQAVDQFSDEWAGGLSLHIANPRRENSTQQDFDTTEKYRKQTRWERAHLFRAMSIGANVFWLACRDLEIPYPKDRPYGQTTRFEFSMAYTEARAGRPIHISLGIEPGYKGSDKYYLDLADELNLPVYNALETTIADALESLE